MNTNRIAVGAGCLLVAVASIGCGDDGEADGEGGNTGNNSSAETTGATSTSSGNVIDLCAPEDGKAIEPNCGIFVNGDAQPGGNGSRDAPFHTLADAIAVSDGANYRIFVCASLDEAAVVPPGRAVHGDVTCDWNWDFSVRTPWRADADEIPVQVTGTTPATITGFAITAEAATLPSGSSIALLVNGGTLDLARVDLVAGDAVSGVDGVSGMNGAIGLPGGNATASAPGTGGTGGCIPGGVGAISTSCSTPEVCNYNQAQPSGLGGMSGPMCTKGDDGADGVDGADGAHGAKGSISPDGFTPVHGINGVAGGNGGASGGGGATPDDAGGGSGAAGCGATPGTAGTSGGSSIAIVSLDALIRFDTVTASVGSGGDGGVGGSGRTGGTGGTGGSGYCDGTLIQCAAPGGSGCGGGKGGDGGDSGTGGSGAGGHAVIIAYTGIINDLGGLTPTVPINIQAGQGTSGSPDGALGVELAFP